MRASIVWWHNGNPLVNPIKELSIGRLRFRWSGFWHQTNSPLTWFRLRWSATDAGKWTKSNAIQCQVNRFCVCRTSIQEGYFEKRLDAMVAVYWHRLRLTFCRLMNRCACRRYGRLRSTLGKVFIIKSVGYRSIIVTAIWSNRVKIETKLCKKGHKMVCFISMCAAFEKCREY